MKTIISQLLSVARFMFGLFCGLSMLGHALLLAQTLFTLPDNWWLVAVIHVAMLLFFGLIADLCFKNKNENKEESNTKTVDAES